MTIKQSLVGKLLDRFGGPSLSDITVITPEDNSPTSKYWNLIKLKYKGVEKTFIFDLSGDDKIIVIEGYAFNLTFKKNTKNIYLTAIGSLAHLTETPKNQISENPRRLDKAINFEDVGDIEKPAYPGLEFTIMNGLSKPSSVYGDMPAQRVFHIKSTDRIILSESQISNSMELRVYTSDIMDIDPKVNTLVLNDNPITLVDETGYHRTFFIDANGNLVRGGFRPTVPSPQGKTPLKSGSQAEKQEKVSKGGAPTVGNPPSSSNTNNSAKPKDSKDSSGGNLSKSDKAQIEPKIFSPNGVGGELKFRIGVPNASKNGFSDAAGYKPASIELAPARQSFFDKQGQRVPGAGGGLEFRSRANLVKLNVPGSRPIYQHMGIAEETIEWVGAFVGFDHPDPKDILEDANHEQRTLDAWTSSYGLLQEMRKGRELMIELAWIDKDSKQEHSLQFVNSVFYRGFIKDLKRTYATSQRVYYYVCFCITNREDLEANTPTEDVGPVALPSTLNAVYQINKTVEPISARDLSIAITGEFFTRFVLTKINFVKEDLKDSSDVLNKLNTDLKKQKLIDKTLTEEEMIKKLDELYESIKLKAITIINILKGKVEETDIDWIRAQTSEDYSYENINILFNSYFMLHNNYFSFFKNESKGDRNQYGRLTENIKKAFEYYLRIKRSFGYPKDGSGNIESPQFLDLGSLDRAIIPLKPLGQED